MLLSHLRDNIIVADQMRPRFVSRGTCTASSPLFRVQFSAPLVRGSALITLIVLSINNLGRLIAIECVKIAEEENGRLVDWSARFQAGVPVRYQLEGGVTGKQIPQPDRQLAEVIGDIRFMEVFGDIKEYGGKSAQDLVYGLERGRL